MDRVQEIVRLEGTADAGKPERSAQRWKAAQLIWEELQSKSFRQLSEEIRATGGRGSLAHLQRMKYCWEQTGKPLAAVGSTLPNFSTIYGSDAVRFPNGRKETTEPRDKSVTPGHVTVTSRANTGWEPKAGRRDGQEADAGPAQETGTSASRWIGPLHAAVEPLTQRAVWSLLAADDIAVVERCARDLAKIVGPARSAAARRVARSRGAKRAKAS